MARQSPSIATSTAETAMPVPTPAKCTAESPLRPADARWSSTSADPNTSTKAEAMPAISRSARKAGIVPARPIAARAAAFTASAASSQARREPGSGKDASSAPAR